MQNGGDELNTLLIALRERVESFGFAVGQIQSCSSHSTERLPGLVSAQPTKPAEVNQRTQIGIS